MLMVMRELKRIGSTDAVEQEVAVHCDTVHRMVPVDGQSVRVTFEDGEEMTLVGTIRELTDQINAPTSAATRHEHPSGVTRYEQL